MLRTEAFPVSCLAKWTLSLPQTNHDTTDLLRTVTAEVYACYMETNTRESTSVNSGVILCASNTQGFRHKCSQVYCRTARNSLDTRIGALNIGGCRQRHHRHQARFLTDWCKWLFSMGFCIVITLFFGGHKKIRKSSKYMIWNAQIAVRLKVMLITIITENK